MKTIPVKFHSSVDVLALKPLYPGGADVCLGIAKHRDGLQDLEYLTCYLTKEQVRTLIETLEDAIE